MAITGKFYEVHKELTLITALILTLNIKTPKETNSVHKAGIILTSKIAKTSQENYRSYKYTCKHLLQTSCKLNPTALEKDCKT